MRCWLCAMTMGPLTQFVAVMLLSWFMNMRAEDLKSSPPCDFPAIFNFGDSNSDTGCMAAAFYPMASPCGQTFFHEPAGRASDGRLIIDFIGKYSSIRFTIFIVQKLIFFF